MEKMDEVLGEVFEMKGQRYLQIISMSFVNTHTYAHIMIYYQAIGVNVEIVLNILQMVRLN